MLRSAVVFCFVLFSSFVSAELVTYEYEGEIKRISNDTTNGIVHVGSKVSGSVTYDTNVSIGPNPYMSFYSTGSIAHNYNDTSFTIKIDSLDSILIDSKVSIGVLNEVDAKYIGASVLRDYFSVSSNFSANDLDYLKTLPSINGETFLYFSLYGLDDEGVAVNKNFLDLPYIFGNTNEYEYKILQFSLGTIDEENLVNSDWGIYSADITRFELAN